MNKIDRLIELVRLLKEEGMGVSAIGGPTNSTNKLGGPITIAGLPPDSPPVSNKNKKYIYLGLGSRKRWIKPKT